MIFSKLQIIFEKSLQLSKCDVYLHSLNIDKPINFFFMSTRPSSFSANKIGYKKYLAAGGNLDYADFRVYERRSAIEIAAEKINRFHAAMIYYYDQAMLAKSQGDQEYYELMMYTSEVRAKQLSQAHQELDLAKQSNS